MKLSINLIESSCTTQSKKPKESTPEFLARILHLSLASHNISFLDAATLGSLHSLTILYLHDNKITDTSPLSSIKTLRQLFLQYNEIDKVWGLNGCTKLTILNLSHNKIGKVFRGDFEGLSELEVFNLDYQRGGGLEFDAGCFHGCEVKLIFFDGGFAYKKRNCDWK